jgi:hypothetical protein
MKPSSVSTTIRSCDTRSLPSHYPVTWSHDSKGSCVSKLRKQYSQEHLDQYDGLGKEVSQSLLMQQGLMFPADALDQPELYKKQDFSCHNMGEEIRFEVEVRPRVDLVAMTVRTVRWKKPWRVIADRVHYPLRKYASMADFFISYCPHNENGQMECLFVVPAVEVLKSCVYGVKCDSSVFHGYDLFFKVPVNRGVRFIRDVGELFWKPLPDYKGCKGLAFTPRDEASLKTPSMMNRMSQLRRLDVAPVEDLYEGELLPDLY